MESIGKSIKIFCCIVDILNLVGNDLFKNWTLEKNTSNTYIDEDDIMKYVDTIMEEYLPKK